MNYWSLPANKPSFEHARLSTTYYSKSFYISSLMLPRERRWATFALYGFCRYADNLIDNPRRRSIEELRTEIESVLIELKIAYRTQESEHPILRPFILSAHRFGIPAEYPIELLKGVQMDLEKTRYETFDELYLFCYRVAGVVGLMMTHVLGYKDEAAFQYAEKLGVAMQLTNIIRDIKEDKEMGRIYLPLEELRQFGVKEQDILRENMSENLRQLLKFSTERAYQYYHEANPGIPMLANESQFAIYAASKIYRAILLKFERQDYNPFNGRMIVPKIKKFGILFREVLRTKRIIWQERLFGYSNVK